jgi:hypothetical protein
MARKSFYLGYCVRLQEDVCMTTFGGCGEAVDEVVGVLEVGGIGLCGPCSTPEEALYTVTRRLEEKVGCGGLEFGAEIGSGLSGLLSDVDVDT